MFIILYIIYICSTCIIYAWIVRLDGRGPKSQLPQCFAGHSPLLPWCNNAINMSCMLYIIYSIISDGPARDCAAQGFKFVCRAARQCPTHADRTHGDGMILSATNHHWFISDDKSFRFISFGWSNLFYTNKLCMLNTLKIAVHCSMTDGHFPVF
jgi:hypothetical protein